VGAFRNNHYIDIHCHCIPGIDDGPGTLPEGLALCRALVDDGIKTVIATPHQLGRFDCFNDAQKIRESVCSLNEQLKNNGVELTVLPGGDVRVDERICRLLNEDRILTLADGGEYILLELPAEIFIDIEPLLFELSSLGIRAIISHPERHPVLPRRRDILLRWLDNGTFLQITAASLLGDFGPVPKKIAWQLLESGLALLVATDSHNLHSRRPRMDSAFQCISAKLGGSVARLVCIENPLRVLEGDELKSFSYRGRLKA